MKRCCTPALVGRPASVVDSTTAAASSSIDAKPVPGLSTLMRIPAGRYRIGTDSNEGFAADREGPARFISLSAYSIAEHPVTNAAFREFIRATGHVTEAEQVGASFVFYLQVDAARRRHLRPVSRDLPWWLWVEGACWQRPNGPGSSVLDRLDHPVVQVSWHDALAYCAWSGTRLPTEAEWEVAARGGLVDARYPWGDELRPQGEARCNIWQGEFPAGPAPGWLPGTTPVDQFAPNGYGLRDMAGNVWQWCADAFDTAVQGDSSAIRRSQRGGSFLCHESYCNRYRVAARGQNTAGSSTSHCGFRVAGFG